MAQLALAWVLRLPNVASAIIGASRPEQVHENAAASGVTLSADVLEAIDAALGGAVVAEDAAALAPAAQAAARPESGARGAAAHQQRADPDLHRLAHERVAVAAPRAGKRRP